MKRKRLLLALDAILATVLACVAIHMASLALAVWKGPASSLTNDLYIPSIMTACGKGFMNADPARVPGLRDFLDFKTMRFDGAQIPADLPAIAFHPYQEYHRYLLYAMGMVWRVTGVSWDATKIFIYALCAITAVLVYGIFRLGMNPAFAAAGTWAYLTLPLMLSTVCNPRDFGKAPFILAVVLLLGFIAKRPTRPRTFFGIAVALGLLIGIGLGFRRDVGVCLIPAMVVVAVASRGDSARPMAQRGAALALLLFAFLASAWPILASFQRHGSLGDHDAMMGLATQCDRQLGMQPASYERIPVLHDMYCSETAFSYRERVWPDTVDGNAKWLYLIKIAATFPGDLIARAYAAVLAALGSPLAVAAAALAFALLSGSQPRMAWIALFMVLYFCGYTSLQYDPRHSFHVNFAGYWMIGFVAHQAAAIAWRYTRRKSDKSDTSDRSDASGASAFSWGTMLLCCGAACAALIVPLYAARVWQQHAVKDLMRTYRTADMEPVAMNPRDVGDWKFFGPESHQLFTPDALAWQREQFRTTYYAAVFDLSATARRSVWIHYEEGGDSHCDFSQCVEIDPPGRLKGGTVTYFFPVYEGFSAVAWSRFAEIAVPASDSPMFKGLYRVRNARDMGLLLNWSLPSSPDALQLYQTLPSIWTLRAGRHPELTPEPEIWGQVRQARGMLASGDVSGAVTAYRKLLLTDPQDASINDGLGDALSAAGNWEGAVLAYQGAVGLDSFNARAEYRLGIALVTIGNLDLAAIVLKRAIELEPRSNEARALYVTVMCDKKDYDAAWKAVEGGRATGASLPRDLMDRLARESGRSS